MEQKRRIKRTRGEQMKTPTQIKAEIEKQKKHWDDLIKIWNNEKLDDKIRNKAEKEIDKLTEEGKGEIEIEATLSGLILAWKNEESRINKFEKEKGTIS